MKRNTKKTQKSHRKQTQAMKRVMQQPSLTPPANRLYKDWLFHMLFSDKAALLSLYNIGIEEVRGERNGTPYRGLLYTLLDENGDKAVAAPLKSSLFGKEVGYDGLERHMERNAERFGKDDTRRQIRGRVDKALRGEPTEEELRERLRGARVDLYIRRNENGRIVGVTFIDHETRTVVNGSRLGKAYSANAFMPSPVL